MKIATMFIKAILKSQKELKELEIMCWLYSCWTFDCTLIGCGKLKNTTPTPSLINKALLVGLDGNHLVRL